MKRFTIITPHGDGRPRHGIHAAAGRPRPAGLVTIEKKHDCWISLLSTPMTGGEIMRAKMLGNLYAARWGLIILTGIWLLGGFFNIRYLLIVPSSPAAFSSASCS